MISFSSRVQNPFKMWKLATKSLLVLGLFACATATWRPIVGPSSSSFNNKIPFGDSHTYYGNEFLSEYASLGNEHLLVPSLSHQPSAVLGSESLSSFGNDVKPKPNPVSDHWVTKLISIPYLG